MPSDALLLASDSINTPRNTLTMSHTTWHHSRLRQDPSNTRVTKIGLIDPDDLTEEDTRHTRGTQYRLLHHRRKGIAEVIEQIAFGSSQLA